MFYQQIQLESNLEIMKTQLAMKPDFNLIDAFRYFDKDGKGWLSIAELMEGIEKLSIDCSNVSIHLYF